jgi:hypothetical protein
MEAKKPSCATLYNRYSRVKSGYAGFRSIRHFMPLYLKELIMKVTNKMQPYRLIYYP